MSRAAIIHNQHIVIGHQRPEQCQVVVPRLGRGVAWAARGCDKSSHALGGTGMRIELEVNGYLARDDSAGVERALEVAAVGGAAAGLQAEGANLLARLRMVA